MITAVCLTAAVLLAGVAVITGRLASWHRQEAAYWRRVHARYLLDPLGTDAEFLPLLDWAQANPPSQWQRFRAWQSPAVRRLDASR